MAISEKEYLILSDLAYDNLVVQSDHKDKTLDKMYFQNGKLSAEGKSLLGVNRYAGSELKNGFQGVLESEDYKDVMSKWKVIAVSNEQENSGYYGVAFEYVGDGENKGEIVLANRGTKNQLAIRS